MLTDSHIQQAAATAGSYIKGCNYFRDGHIQTLEYFPNINSFRAIVMGSKKYIVYIDFNDNYAACNYECNCKAYDSYHGACKHIVAVLKSIQANWYKYFGQQQVLTPVYKHPPPKQNNLSDTKIHLTTAAKDMLRFFHNTATSGRSKIPLPAIKLVPTLSFVLEQGITKNWLEFSIGSDRLYILKDIPQFLKAFDDNHEIVYGKHFTFTPQQAGFDEQSQLLLQLLRSAYTDEKQLIAWKHYNADSLAFNETRRFKLSNSALYRFLEIMDKNQFAMSVNYLPSVAVRIIHARPPVNLSVQPVKNGLKLVLNLNNNIFFGLDAHFQYIFHQQNIYKVDKEFSDYIKPLLNCLNENKKQELLIPNTAASDFFSAALPALEKIGTINVSPELKDKIYKEPLISEVYFDRFGDGISARIEFKYGLTTINAITNEITDSNLLSGQTLIRSVAAESRLLEIFNRHNFKPQAGLLMQPSEEQAYLFLQEGMPELGDMAEIYYSDEFKNITIKHPGQISAGIKLNTDSNLLELSFSFNEIKPNELFALLSSYKLKKKYHRLPDGAFLSLDAPEIQTIAQLVEQLDLTAVDIAKTTVELPKFRAMYIDNLTRSADFHIERNSAFKRMVQDIREPQDMEFQLPDGIQGKLRDYQKTGYKWLKSLASYGLGGILADDMGLGKTLQVITFIMSEKSHTNMPSLVIAPTSLVYNWQEEVKKFAPTLNTIIISGQQSERQEQAKSIKNTHLVITSYALIKRDLALYNTVKFDYCFLDEAQHIKNPQTITAKAVKKINAGGYFALTGTPIENSLTELWSIFDFLMPGYLGNHKTFINRFESPIVKSSDQSALTELSRHIKPFILRRMKKTVLKELPEKIETRMVNEMTGEQTKIYTAYLLQAKQEFEAEIAASGFAKSQIKILSLLTRLRQICCHPSLFIENYTGGCGKLEMVQELITDAVDGGHRILLFSQFTGMLKILKEEFTKANIEYFYLDGSTKADDRISLVNSFNAGNKNIFLISLKAGGTGLNLTGADMVIHYDPWWNPAVEDQATDRAYRIGQKNSVQVCKLVTRNTIEEKIYELQQKKKELIDSLIKPGENFLTKLSEQELRHLFG